MCGTPMHGLRQFPFPLVVRAWDGFTGFLTCVLLICVRGLNFTVRRAREGRLNHYDGRLPFTSEDNGPIKI